MVANSGKQIEYTVGVLNAAEKTDRAAFDKAMTGLLKTLQNINLVMDTMWKRSKPEDYNHFRTFIMGTKNQVSATLEYVW